MKLLLCILVTLFVKANSDEEGWFVLGSPLFSAHPCKNVSDIVAHYEGGKSPTEENSYVVRIEKEIPKHSVIYLKFDAEASVTLSENSYARINVDGNDDNTFRIDFFESKSGFSFEVQGLTLGVVPYFKSIKINTKEYCKEPLVGYLDGVIQGYKPKAVSRSGKPDGNCGRRKVVHTELIVNGASTKAGDWPWHVALYKINRSEIKYICGGTLISNYYVLTAAHCASIRGNPIVPEALSVILGKYHLVGGDDGTQERQVHQIILHEEYNQRYLQNDIALLKLKSEVTFTDYVQPACLWHSHAFEKLSPTSDIVGTIVGWGFDNTDELSPHLRQAQLPIVPDATCIKSYPAFYSMVLDDNKFCAGFRNGVSACNGDSGSAFLIFVPDKEDQDNNTSLGTWYVRGIVSLTVSKKDMPICDPNYYGVYTDVAKYVKWIEDHAQI